MLLNKDIWQQEIVLVFQELLAYVIQDPENSFKCLYFGIGDAYYTCEVCGHTWHSVKSQVRFKYISNVNGEWKLRFNLSRQKCRRCKRDYKVPEFPSDQIYFVLEQLVLYIIERYYKHDADDMDSKHMELVTKYEVAGEGTHQEDLCEACANGICQSRRRRRHLGKPPYSGKPADCGKPADSGKPDGTVTKNTDLVETYEKWTATFDLGISYNLVNCGNQNPKLSDVRQKGLRQSSESTEPKTAHKPANCGKQNPKLCLKGLHQSSKTTKPKSAHKPANGGS